MHMYVYIYMKKMNLLLIISSRQHESHGVWFSFQMYLRKLQPERHISYNSTVQLRIIPSWGFLATTTALL